MLAQAKVISPKRDTCRLSRSGELELAQARVREEAISVFLQFSRKQEYGRPSETFLQPEELYLT